MEISSPSFGNGQRIPDRFTCQGDDVSPGLAISGAPPEAKSLAIIMDDPDAPGGTWVHWVVWDAEPAGRIPEGASGLGTDGTNSGGRRGYHGPCPPRGHGIHHYHFKVYALDSILGLEKGAGKEGLLSAMEGHVLASAELMGTYERR
jgi:Raf kinase inhibitor-like YbhB/YbcL family protein